MPSYKYIVIYMLKLKGLVHPKMKMSLMIHPHVVSSQFKIF